MVIPSGSDGSARTLGVYSSPVVALNPALVRSP